MQTMNVKGSNEYKSYQQIYIKNIFYLTIQGENQDKNPDSIPERLDHSLKGQSKNSELADFPLYIFEMSLQTKMGSVGRKGVIGKL